MNPGVIQSRLEAHMTKVGVDRLMAKRICREIDISKDKLVPFNKQDFLHKKGIHGNEFLCLYNIKLALGLTF